MGSAKLAGTVRYSPVKGKCGARRRRRQLTHGIHLLLVEELSLRRVQMLQGVRVGAASPWGHGAHERGGIHLGAGSGHAHVANHLMRYASGLGARLARIVSHGRSHGMAWRDSWMLLHAGWMRKTWSHACHHLRGCWICRLSTRWIFDPAVLSAIACAFPDQTRLSLDVAERRGASDSTKRASLLSSEPPRGSRSREAGSSRTDAIAMFIPVDVVGNRLN